MGWIWPTVCSIYLLFYTQQKEFSFLTTLLPFSNLNTTFLFSFLSLFFTPLKKLMYSSNKIINKQSAVTVRPFYGRKTIMKIKSLTKVYFNFRMRRRKKSKTSTTNCKGNPEKAAQYDKTDSSSADRNYNRAGGYNQHVLSRQRF